MSQPLQILHVVSRLDGYGTAGQLRLLARQQLAEGDSVLIAALAADRLTLDACHQEGMGLSVLDRRWRRDPFAAIRLAGEFRRQTYDVAHLWGPLALEYFALTRHRLLNGLAKGPTLATLGQSPCGLRRAALVDRIVVASESARTRWECHGIASDRIAVIPPGISASASPTPTREQFLRSISLPQDSKLLAVSCQLLRSRRVDDAIWFFELVRTLDERARLLIFGNGPDHHRLERFTRLTSEPDAVRFLGFRTDLTTILPHVDVFWSLGPDAVSHAPPISLIEAMVSRVPVVSADTEASREIIVDEKSGFLVPPSDRAGFARQTLRLLDNGDLANNLVSAAADQMVTRFSLESMTRNYGRLYQQLLLGDTTIIY